MCTHTRGCIYSCYTPDDGCKKRPKHVEYSTSEIKVTTQLHRVDLFNTEVVLTDQLDRFEKLVKCKAHFSYRYSVSRSYIYRCDGQFSLPHVQSLPVPVAARSKA